MLDALVYPVQGRLHDLMVASGERDPVGWVAQLAKVYVAKRGDVDQEQLADAMAELPTGAFRGSKAERRQWLADILPRIDSRFLSQVMADAARSTPPEPARVQAIAQSDFDGQAMSALLDQYRAFVERNGLHYFWQARRKGVLKPGPEAIAEGLLMAFADRPVKSAGGFGLRQVSSGVGYIDLMIVGGNAVRYLVELKVLRAGEVLGHEQLQAYLRTEGETEGWLVVIDARPPAEPKEHGISTDAFGELTIHAVRVDINPRSPHELNRKNL